MLNIAICDDDENQRLITSQLLNEYIQSREIAARIREFASARDLLNAIEETSPFDIYLLDVMMPEMSGIELGMTLRKAKDMGVVIYLSISPDFALASYQVRAYHYLLKPVNRDALFRLLDEVALTQDRLHNNGIQVKTHEGTLRLLYDNILYAELKNRAVRYYLKDGGYVNSMTLRNSFKEAMMPLLDDNRFLMCGASFVVNLYYIKMVDRSGALLSGNHRLELPKTACTTLRAAWSDYWFEGGKRE